MPQTPMPEPDASKPLSSATGVLRLHPDDARFEADFADLAARFAKSGGGLSPELSADLALEIVLNEIVEQACLGTGATGAAIVLQRDGEWVCRASNGATAPELGSRLDTVSGLSGECLSSHRTQRCDDVLSDPRADVGASQRLGVRSVMVMPLLRGNELVGVFELFSSRPFAFGDRDEGTLEILADRIVSNLDQAAQPPEVAVQPAPELPPEPVFALLPDVATEPMPVLRTAEEAPEEEAPEELLPALSTPRRFDMVSTVLAVAVVACAVLLGLALGRHFGWQKTEARAHSTVPASPGTSMPSTPSSPATTAPTQTSAPPAAEKSAVQQPSPRTSPAATNNESVPAGGLLVYENGKEVFRMEPAQGQGPAGVERASSVEPLKLSPAAAEGSLLHRVEPEYPEDARSQKIQGAVVLDVHIGADGAVQDVELVSGPSELAQSSTDAVKQWRFRPRKVNGHAVEMQTRVTLNFRLPQ